MKDLKPIGGMGDKTADEILEYRPTHGPIHDFSQFKEIFGMGIIPSKI